MQSDNHHTFSFDRSITALVAEQFLESSASQLTYHGLSELSSQLKEDELVVLFRNNHFITLYRHKVRCWARHFQSSAGGSI